MHIGYDVNCLGEKNVTGIGRAASRLYAELRKSPRISVSPFLKMSRWKRKSRVERRLGEPVQIFQPWRRRSIDVYHGPDFRVPSGGSFAKVVTIHDLTVFHDDYGDPKFLKASRRKTTSTIFHSGVDHIIAISEFTKGEILRFFPDLKIPITIIHHGVDIRTSATDCPAGLQRKPYFLFVGTNERRKNLGLTIDAFLSSGLVKHGYRLKVVGADGHAAAEELKGRESSAVELLGFVQDDELERLYRSASALVFPSLYEGFGLPILEAMSFGTPVITSRLGACFEVAGSAALTVDPRSKEHIGDAMNLLAKSPRTAEVLSEKGLNRAREFSWTRMAQRTIEVYETARRAKSDQSRSRRSGIE